MISRNHTVCGQTFSQGYAPKMSIGSTQEMNHSKHMHTCKLT